jgi:hypothetical protein
MIVKKQRKQELMGFDVSGLITGVSQLAAVGIQTGGAVRTAKYQAEAQTALARQQSQLSSENMKFLLVGGGLLAVTLVLLKDKKRRK